MGRVGGRGAAVRRLGLAEEVGHLGDVPRLTQARRQLLLALAAGGSGGGGGGTSDTNAGAEGALVGRRVQIHGLTTRADMNGLEGVATSYSQHRGRYIVMSAGGVETAIKPSNLRAV